MSQDRISNYRQVRLILSPWEGDWRRAYWSLHFLTVRQGVPRSEVAQDGLIIVGEEVPTRLALSEALASLCSHLATSQRSRG